MYPLHRRSNAQYNRDDVIAELTRLKETLDRFPSLEDVRNHGRIGPKPMQRIFGSWENVKRAIGWIPEYEKIPVDNVTVEDGNWLAGLIDGEGCFRLGKPSPSMEKRGIKSFSPVFCITLRDDDKEALVELQRILGTKLELRYDNRDSIKDTQPNAKPAFKIFITDLPTLKFVLVPVLERYPLRSKKRRDLILFKLAISILYQKKSMGDTHKAYTEAERDTLNHLYWALREIKQYKSDLDTVIEHHNLRPLFQDISHLVVGRRKPKGRPKLLP